MAHVAEGRPLTLQVLAQLCMAAHTGVHRKSARKQWPHRITIVFVVFYSDYLYSLLSLSLFLLLLLLLPSALPGD